MAKPLIAILIPAFNAEEWIADSLRSALEQTWDRTEIIVVDDGSQDRTLAIASQFASRHVVVVTQQNQGAAAARNKALSLSQGDYIQWLDADDLLAPDKIARQVDVLAEIGTRTLLSSEWGRFLYRPTHAHFEPTALWCDLTPVEWLIRKMSQNLYMQTATWLVSRELTEAAGPWNTELLGDDDGEYFCRVLIESDGVRFVPQAKVLYRMTGTRRLSYVGTSHRKMDAQLRSMELHMSYLRRLEDSDRSRLACVLYLENWLNHFYPHRPDIVLAMKTRAKSLGAEIGLPKWSWKYSWIARMFGTSVARRAQTRAQLSRWAVQRWWDKVLAHRGEAEVR